MEVVNDLCNGALATPRETEGRTVYGMS